MVDVKYKRKLKRPITLTELKSHKELSTMRVVQRGNRLSITEVSKNEWDYILNLENKYDNYFEFNIKLETIINILMIKNN